MTEAVLPTSPKNNANLRVVFICLFVVIGMAGLAYAAVPLYQLFCQVTGYGGTIQRSAGNDLGVINREMKTRFDVNVSPGLNWTVEPAAAVSSKIGSVQTVVYTATNRSNQTVTATAGFNVAPDLMGLYFNKIECFCFTEQTLEPGQSVEMPITFFIDPELDDVRELNTIREVTLSYTFYPSESGRS